MKITELQRRSAIVRDKFGLPNYKSIVELVQIFSQEEIAMMVNHYLMTESNWRSVDEQKFTAEFRTKCCIVHQSGKLKKNIPLIEQITSKNSA